MSVTAAKGFVASGVHCGIRKRERLDLSLVHSLVPATGAGMFTINRMLAAPVIVCREHAVAREHPRARCPLGRAHERQVEPLLLADPTVDTARDEALCSSHAHTRIPARRRPSV